MLETETYVEKEKGKDIEINLNRVDREGENG